MTYKEYKTIVKDKFDYDVFEAEMQVAWYTRELRNHKYNSVQEAQENLGVWKKRLDGLERRKKQLKEMFSIYEEKNVQENN